MIPIAGDQITNDIAMALRTPTKEAEDIKIQHAVALVAMADPSQMIEVPGVGERGPRQMSRATLAEVVEPRVEELFQLVQQELRRSGFEDLLSSGIVLTGGASLMPGMVELAEEVFHMPVRVGVPKYVGGLAEVVKTRASPPASACCCTARTRFKRMPAPRWRRRVWARCSRA